MLTRKQKELLLLIRDRVAADGVSPSFDEMKEALGLKSKSGIHRLITGLEERGFIKRLPHRALKSKNSELRHPVRDGAIVPSPPARPMQVCFDMVERERQQIVAAARLREVPPFILQTAHFHTTPACHPQFLCVTSRPSRRRRTTRARPSRVAGGQRAASSAPRSSRPG